MKIFFAGTPSNSREQTLIGRKVSRRLLTFAERDRAIYVLRKWGRIKEKSK